MNFIRIQLRRTVLLGICVFFAGCGMQPPKAPEGAPAVPVPETRGTPQPPEAEGAAEPAYSFEVLPPEGLWEPDEAQVVHTVYVDGSYSAARSGAPGSAENPFGAIQPAVEAAPAQGGSSEGVRIRIAAGTYRETVDISGWDRDAPLILEGAGSGEGEVILSGSDRFTKWTAVPNTDRIFRHDWPHRFGPQPNPWPGLMPMKEGESFRRELFFVNGRPYRQVYAPSSLTGGTYLIDEERGAVYFKPDADFPAPDPVIEISVRPQAKYGAHSKLIRVINSRNIAIRNLTVQHAATVPFNSGALQVLGTENLLIEDVVSQWNNGSGIALASHRGQAPERVTLRRVKANHNGTLGLEGGMHHGLIEDSETSFNNWRGGALGATGWAPCGFKLSGLHRVHLKNHTANFNHASGGWFDDHIEHVLVENFTAVNNFRSGMSLEAVDGPMVVRDSLFMGNSTGLNLFDSVGISMENNRVLNNQLRGIRIAGSEPLPEEELEAVTPDWRRWRLSKRRSPQHLRIVGSVIGSTESDVKDVLIEFGMRDHAFERADGSLPLEATLATLELGGNVYGLPREPQESFRNARNEPISLAEWQELVSGDGDAEWDAGAVQRELDAAVAETGLRPDGFGKRDRTRGTEQVDELEL